MDRVLACPADAVGCTDTGTPTYLVPALIGVLILLTLVAVIGILADRRARRAAARAHDASTDAEGAERL